jgi:hypothetical protein
MNHRSVQSSSESKETIEARVTKMVDFSLDRLSVMASCWKDGDIEPHEMAKGLRSWGRVLLNAANQCDDLDGLR